MWQEAVPAIGYRVCLMVSLSASWGVAGEALHVPDLMKAPIGVEERAVCDDTC